MSNKVCKYKKRKKQVSYDNGVTWQDVTPLETMVGDLIESNSPTCGYVGEYTRWTDSGSTYCDGYNKYQLQIKEISYDGVNWNITDETQNKLIETNSEDCGYEVNQNVRYIYMNQKDVYDSQHPNACYIHSEGEAYKCTYANEKYYGQVWMTFTSNDEKPDGGFLYSYLTTGYTEDDGYKTYKPEYEKDKKLVYNFNYEISEKSDASYITAHFYTDNIDYNWENFNINDFDFNIYGFTLIGFEIYKFENITYEYIGKETWGKDNNVKYATIKYTDGTTGYVCSLNGGSLPSSAITSSTYPITTIEEITFHKYIGLNNIKNKLFSGATNLKKVLFEGDNIEYIYASAFEKCTSLECLYLPESISSIGNYAFYGCSKLKCIQFTSFLKPSFGNYVFSGCDNLQHIKTPSGSNWNYLCSVLQEKHDSTFDCSVIETSGGCTCFDEIDLFKMKISVSSSTGTDVVTVPIKRFEKNIVDDDRDYFEATVGKGECIFTKIEYGNTISGITIGNSLFSEKIFENVTELILPDSLYTLIVGGFGTTFPILPKLKKLTIPCGVREIYNLEIDSTDLKSITFESTLPPDITLISGSYSGSTVFDNTNNCTLYVPSNAVDTYKNKWTKYASRIKSSYNSSSCPSTGETGDEELYYGATTCLGFGIRPITKKQDSKLLNPLVSRSQNYLGGCGCNSNSYIAEIGYYDTANDTMIYKQIPCDYIYNNYSAPAYTRQLTAFINDNMGGKELVSIKYGKCIEEVEPLTESNTSSERTATSILFSDDFSSRYYECTDRMNNLTYLSIPDSVVYLNGNHTFENLANIKIGNNVRVISEFTKCNSLTKIVIPDSVWYLLYGAFGYCPNLNDVTIGKNVRAIDGNAFYPNGDGNRKVTILAKTPPKILGNYFQGDRWVAKTSIYVPLGSLNAYKTAAGWSAYADVIYPIP